MNKKHPVKAELVFHGMLFTAQLQVALKLTEILIKGAEISCSSRGYQYPQP